MSDPFFQRVRDLQQKGATLAAIEALGEGSQVQLTYFFLLEGKCERVVLAVVEGSCPSLIQVYGGADYIERSLFRRHCIKFVGNPNLESSA